MNTYTISRYVTCQNHEMTFTEYDKLAEHVSKWLKQHYTFELLVNSEIVATADNSGKLYTIGKDRKEVRI